MAGSRLAEQRNRTSERVLATASELMARRGYSGTSISSISKASGILPASIYWHFESKEGLLAAVVDRACERWFQELRAEMERVEPEGDPALAPFSALRRVFERDPDFFRLLLLLAIERRDENSEATRALRRARERVREFLRAAFAPFIAIDDEVGRRRACDRLAELTLVQIDGAFIAHQIAPDSTDLSPLLALLEVSLAAAAGHLIEQARPRLGSAP